MDGKKKTDILFKVTDPIGTDVSLRSKTWDHIRERHPEIRKIGQVRETIQKPEFIMLNESRNTKTYTTISSIRLFLNVHTTISENGNYVATAHLTGDVPKGDCIWQRPKK